MLNAIGLAISTTYLFISLLAKHQANQVFESSFSQQNLEIERYASRPAPFNILLWTVNAEVKNGYYSFLDDSKNIAYSWYPKDHELLLQQVQTTENVKQLIDLSENWYTVDPAQKGVIFNDLRFGQMSGWKKDNGNFVFSYLIVEENGQVNIYETERDIGKGMELLKDLWSRIMGNQ